MNFSAQKAIHRYRHGLFRSLALKRLMDVSGAILVLLATFPLFLVIAAILSSYVGIRSVIYVHERVGKDGKPFGCLKFRSMQLDADERLEKLLENSPDREAEWNATRKLRDDPRIIPRIGHILRQSSLDELPQIFNVILGNMSLVGPRPVTEEELTHYGASESLYKSVRPGMTGPWQVGDRSNGSYAYRVDLDTSYVKRWTLVGDLCILGKTARMMLRGTKNPNAF